MYFLFRRLVMALVVVLLKDHLIFQIMLVEFSIIAGAIIAGYSHFRTPKMRNTELANEAIMMCVLYCIVCFSPFVPDIRARQIFGYICCIIVTINMAVNLCMISHFLLQELKPRLKLWLARLKLYQQRTKNAVKIKTRKHILKEAI